MIRHIVIDGIDRNACCGTQVPLLSHCGFIHVIPPSTPSSATQPSSLVPTKLYFTAGPRAINYLTQASRNISLAAQAVGVGRDGLVERSAKNEEQRKDLIVRERDLRLEMAKMIAEKALAESGGVVWIQRSEKGTHDFESLGAIANGFVSSDEKRVIVITSTPIAVSPSLLLIQSKDQELAKEVNEKLKAAVEGEEKGRVKGGGAKGRFMSKIEGKWRKEDVAGVERVIGAVSEWL